LKEFEAIIESAKEIGHTNKETSGIFQSIDEQDYALLSPEIKDELPQSKEPNIKITPEPTNIAIEVYEEQINLHKSEIQDLKANLASSTQDLVQKANECKDLQCDLASKQELISAIQEQVTLKDCMLQDIQNQLKEVEERFRNSMLDHDNLASRMQLKEKEVAQLKDEIAKHIESKEESSFKQHPLTPASLMSIWFLYQPMPFLSPLDHFQHEQSLSSLT
jgi:chromosome segregation ATPase